MFTKELLDAICEESETMIIEWAENQNEPGRRVIDEKLDAMFDDERVRPEERKVFRANLRALILLDMMNFQW